jgi:hypothetical protein
VFATRTPRPRYELKSPADAAGAQQNPKNSVSSSSAAAIASGSPFYLVNVSFNFIARKPQNSLKTSAHQNLVTNYDINSFTLYKYYFKVLNI